MYAGVNWKQVNWKSPNVIVLNTTTVNGNAYIAIFKNLCQHTLGAPCVLDQDTNLVHDGSNMQLRVMLMVITYIDLFFQR